MSTSEGSPSRLGNALSRNRRKKGDAASEGSDGRSSLRSSISGAVDKLKHNNDDAPETETSGISKLIPSVIKSKRRRKKAVKEAEERADEEAARGRQVGERGTLQNDDGSSDDEAGDGSSLMTYESDTESLVIKPTLSTHPSHSGYLTTSSPLVKAESVPEQMVTDTNHYENPPSTTSFTHTASESSQSLNDSLRAPTDTSHKRSPSPVGRLKEAFKPKDKNTSPERKRGPVSNTLSPSPQQNGSAERRGSVSSRISAMFPDRTPPPIPTSSTISLPERRQTKGPSVLTAGRPSTPENPDLPPVIVNTPPTPTDPSSPQLMATRERGISEPTSSTSNVVTSPSGNMISHRRVRTNSATLGPSKLSNIISAPLTPTPENGPNPGGFFSSVFSAAQNAANTLSNSIANTNLAPNQQRSKSVIQDTKELNPEEDVEVEMASDKAMPTEEEEKEPAVKTMGSGDLSLSQLGISESPNKIASPTTASFADIPETRGRSETVNTTDTTIHRNLTHGVIADTVELGAVDEPASLVRPRTDYESGNLGDWTPPNDSFVDGKAGINRSSSIRSKVGNSRRKRNSSAATGNTGSMSAIGAAIAAANSSVAHPAANGAQPKLTGFAVASKKRNRDFHQLFRSVPDDDYLIEDYSCALQREILAHGRLYVSEGHLCFSSNIFGWVTTLVMSFDEIVSVEKRSTALLFKNGLMISTLHAKNVFASFTSRDSTYDLIVGIWKLGHPSLRSSLNGVRIDETGGGDKTEKDDGLASQSASDSEDESDEGDEMYDQDEDDEDETSINQLGEGSVVGSEVGEKVLSRKPSAAVVSGNGNLTKEVATGAVSAAATDYPGPATHSSTDCSDHDTHYEKILADEVISAPIGKVYDLLFGPKSVTWLTKWLTVDQKCLDLQMEDKKGLTADNKVRVFSYVKPLYGAIGPKQTKCIITETLDAFDLEKAVSITCSTQTPDVPSGNIFLTKTKYCLTWAEGGGTRLYVNCSVEWSGKSWLRGPIEKGANDGQVTYAKDITAAIKAAIVTTKSPTAGSGPGGKKGKKSRKGQSTSKSSVGQKDGASDSKTVTTAEDWGLFEPIRGIASPIVDIVKPLLSGNMVYGLLVGLLVAAWFGWGGGTSSRRGGREMAYFGTPERIAAYEEIWRKEESDLWDWLEERVGMNRLSGDAPMGAGRMGGVGGVGGGYRNDEVRDIEDKLRAEKVSERDVDIAIKVTEEKLKALKGVVERGKQEKESGGKDGQSSVDDATA